MPTFNEDVEITGGNDLILRNASGVPGIWLDGSSSTIVLRNASGGNGIWLYGGEGTVTAMLAIHNAGGDMTIALDGDAGDIRLAGADCAELFEVDTSCVVDPGTVLVVEGDSLLRPCNAAYDRRVAGIVSGAGGLRPGVMLGSTSAGSNRAPVALIGKTYCKVDAQYGAIELGDLLTTSATMGHAMKAVDPGLAYGAMIGKALGSLFSGQGLVPILVSLG